MRGTGAHAAKCAPVTFSRRSDDVIASLLAFTNGVEARGDRQLECDCERHRKNLASLPHPAVALGRMARRPRARRGKCARGMGVSEFYSLRRSLLLAAGSGRIDLPMGTRRAVYAGRVVHHPILAPLWIRLVGL